jgi:hypothetical protein
MLEKRQNKKLIVCIKFIFKMKMYKHTNYHKKTEATTTMIIVPLWENQPNLLGKTFSSSLLVELFCGVGIEAFWNLKLLFNESTKVLCQVI